MTGRPASDLDAQFRSQLESLGWERHDVNVYLCHVGMPQPDGEDVTLRRVGPDDAEMAEWVRRRGAGFADTDWVDRGAADLEAEVRQRRLQEADGAEMFLVDRAGSPAGIAAWYSRLDRQVFNLEVLPEARGSGVGAAVMARAVADAEWSRQVNTDEEHGPVDLCRRGGFIDEVYCRIAYRRGPR